VSIALRNSGVNLKGAKNHTNPGSNAYGNGNIVGATNLAWFLRKNYHGRELQDDFGFENSYSTPMREFERIVEFLYGRA
jgi:hypothetical protein